MTPWQVRVYWKVATRVEVERINVAIEPRISDDVFKVLAPDRSVKSRTSFGGTAPANVRREAQKWLKRLRKKAVR